LVKFSPEQKTLIRRCVVDSVDAGIHDFLFKLQKCASFKNDIQVRADGQNIVGLSDGIHGALFGTDGWQARFSKHGSGF
jgi:hypothetical protein